MPVRARPVSPTNKQMDTDYTTPLEELSGSPLSDRAYMQAAVHMTHHSLLDKLAFMRNRMRELELKLMEAESRLASLKTSLTLHWGEDNTRVAGMVRECTGWRSATNEERDLANPHP